MPQFRFAQAALLTTLLGLNMAPGFITGVSVAYAADAASLRPEIGNPLKAAQDDIKKNKFKDALAKIHDADVIGGKSAYESYMVERMRAAAAQGTGDSELAAKSYESVINSGQLPAAEKGKIVQALGSLYYQAKDYPKAIVWLTRYLSEGGDDPRIRPLLVQSYYLSGDYARAIKEIQAQIQTDEKAGRTPSEEQLQLLYNCATKQNDKAVETTSLEKLLTYYPKKDLWVYLLNHLESKPGFNESRLGLDVYRLRLAAGALSSTNNFMNMVELALQAGYPTEAKKVAEAAFKAGAFGIGPEAARHKRLQDLAAKNAAEDLKTLTQTEAEASKAKEGTGMVNLGYDYVTIGQFDKGIALMEKGMAKGGLKRADDAKLHLAIAYLLADKKAKALQTFKSVQGADGTAELARYWTVLTNHSTN